MPSRRRCVLPETRMPGRHIRASSTLPTPSDANRSCPAFLAELGHTRRPRRSTETRKSSNPRPAGPKPVLPPVTAWWTRISILSLQRGGWLPLLFFRPPPKDHSRVRPVYGGKWADRLAQFLHQTCLRNCCGIDTNRERSEVGPLSRLKRKRPGRAGPFRHPICR